MTLPTTPCRRDTRRLLAAGFLILALAGCATPQLAALRAEPPAGVPVRAEITAVPFFAQDEFQCGPAALAMALAATGADVTPEKLATQIWLPQRRGSLQAEMLAGARRHGFVGVTIRPSLSDLIAEVAAGHPVVVLQNLAFGWYPVWHYAVAVGYDAEREVVLLRSGLEARQELNLDTFERTWERSGHWAMLALPPEELPATLSVDEYVSAVVRLERAGKNDSARRAYARALERWPEHPRALLGLGNTAYAAGDLEEAEQVFREFLSAHPDSPVAANNLAYTLFSAGRGDEALVFAYRAVELGGPNVEAARRTLDQIMSGVASR